MTKKPNTAVVGAGPSGLAACKVLRERGIPVTCFEAGDRVGGQWILDNSSGCSACYRSVVTNTHLAMLQYSDFAPDASYPDFPDHEQMAAFFESYAEQFGLWDAIELSTRVTSAVPTEDGEWRVGTEHGTGGSFDALVVASGRFGTPNLPDFPGEFGGDLIHSQQYMDPVQPVDCRNRDVLVVGLGNTACDLAVELSAPGAARRVLLSSRSGKHIIPKRINGKLPVIPHPADPTPLSLRLIPAPLRAGLMSAAVPLAIRFMTRGLLKPELVGLPEPSERPNPTNVVANDHVLERVRSGAIEFRPALRTLNDGQAEFADGSAESVDVVIAATGYDISLPYLPPEIQGSAHTLKLYRGVLHPLHHNLYFVGLVMGLCANWPFSEQQAMWVANHLTGRVVLPDAKRILRHSETAAAISRGTLNCQFSADELRRDYRSR